MKFALNVAALAVGVVMVLRTAPVQSFSTPNRKLVLDVTANDHIWAKHLNVGIKFEPKSLSAAAQKVLVGLKVIKAMSTGAQEQEPAQEQAVEIAEEIVHKPARQVVVAKALDVVVDVASHYNNHGAALDFALDTIASAIKCNTLMYILVQLHAIKEINDMQNDAITTQPHEVWHTLVHVLNKVALLKKSLKGEFQLYRHWEVVATEDKTKELPQDFNVFKDLVEESLNESCQLSTFEGIKEFIGLHNPDKWDTVDKTITIFSDCQKLLKEMLNDIPISATNIKVWEIFLDKPEFEGIISSLKPTG